jgi:hypothetical protein
MGISSAHAVAYSAKPISARVVDAVTGQPLAGVNVVASWELEDPVAARGQGALELMEDVTDANGEFHFPGWGPKPVPTDAFPGTRLTNEDPRIVLFKTGYFPNAVYNDSHSTLLRDPKDVGAAIRDSQWDGKTILLKKFEGEPRTYASLVYGVLSGVSFGQCGWKKMPKMIIAINQESDRLMREKIVSFPVAWPLIKELVANDTKECGPVLDYLHRFE